jgi:RHS repeat-associated protein
LFTGREWIGEIGIYDYRNRIYSPELGRFLQTDPIRFEAGDVNLYRYVFNSSVDYFDSFGTDHKKKRQSTGKLTGSKKQKHDKSSPGARPKGGARGNRKKPHFTPVGLAIGVLDDFFEGECPKGQYWRIIEIDDCGVPIYGCTGNLSA